MATLFFPWVFTLFQLFPPTDHHPAETKTYRYDYENVLGTSFELKVSANAEQTADYAEQVALTEIDRLNAILSTYDPESEVSQWQKTKDIELKISPELFEVFQLFDNWQLKTNRALNPSVGSATMIWKNAADNQLVPVGNELTAAIKSMSQRQWLLNTDKMTAIHLTNQGLTLNSFVKSYVIRKVSEKVMDIPGVSGAVVNIGGDMVIAGSQIEWVSIADPMADAENDAPLATLRLQGKAVATSGNYRRGFQIGNQWFSHIIDPRTAYPASHIRSATVIAGNATDAGALATAFNVLQPEESKALASSMSGVQYEIITSEGAIIKSEGWKALEVPDPAFFTPPFTKPDQTRLTIDLELARFEGRFRRPFVAVWVENKKKETVKTLALWYNKPRWLPDLKRWYGKNQAIMQDSVMKNSISSATRSAGKYTLTWDGLDDHGKVVPAGKYTVFIEAAREHGTYQLIKQEIEWNGKPAHYDMEAGIEITSSSLTISK